MLWVLGDSKLIIKQVNRDHPERDYCGGLSNYCQIFLLYLARAYTMNA